LACFAALLPQLELPEALLGQGNLLIELRHRVPFA
jgi:hypothetical protein